MHFIWRIYMNTLRTALLAVFVGFCTVFSAVAGGNKDAATDSLTLRKGELCIGVNIAYPPFEYYDADGKTPLGFDMDLGRAIAEKMGLKATIIDVDWEGIFAGLDTRRYDCVISGVTITDERKAHYEFTKPYVGNGQAIILRKGTEGSIKSPEDLTGKKIAYLTESTSDVYMTKLAEKGLSFEALEYDDAMNTFADLKNGRCDAVVSDALVAIDYVSKADSPFVIVWQGDAEEVMGIGFKKGNVALQQAVDKALDELFADGTVKKLSEKNFGTDIVSSMR